MISINCFETLSLRQRRCLESRRITGERRLPGRNKLTLIADNHVPDDLTLAVVNINAWNRIAISFRQEECTDRRR